MATSQEKKKAQVAVLKDLTENAYAITVAINKGISSNDMNDLRNKAREKNVKLVVAKNTLSKIVLKDNEAFNVICEDLKNPVMLGFSMEDLSSATKVLGDFAKTNDRLELQAAAIEGVRYGADQLSYVMNLPNREQALGMVVLGMQAPLVKLTGSLQELYGQFARVLHAVAEQKQD